MRIVAKPCQPLDHAAALWYPIVFVRWAPSGNLSSLVTRGSKFSARGRLNGPSGDEATMAERTVPFMLHGSMPLFVGSGVEEPSPAPTSDY